MKIGLIGPTYPFRGGISHYTTYLCEYLRKKNEVIFVSFMRQYPKWLYFGKSDRDSSKNPLKVLDVEYIIDSLNPLTWVKSAIYLMKHKPDFIIVSWWVIFWAPHYYIIVGLIRIFSKVKITYLCHNVIEHESNWFRRFISKIVLKLGDRYITHSKSESENLKELLGSKADIVTAFHPTYPSFDEHKYSKEKIKKYLNLSGDVILFFGFIRKYKGLDIILNAMPEILKHKKVTLLVVGEFWNDKDFYLNLIKENGISQNVVVIDRYIPNEEVSNHFICSDIAVLPYRSVSGSGICQLAYGYNVPVIATNIGCFSEIIENSINGCLVPPMNTKALADAVVNCLTPSVLSNLTKNAAKTGANYSWDKLVDLIAS